MWKKLIFSRRSIVKFHRIFPLFLLIIAIGACSREMNFFELATSSPSLSVKVGNLLVPPGAGSHDFGNVETYKSGAPVVFTIENTGPLKLFIRGISFVEADDFSFVKDTSGLPSTLGVGQSTSFTVAFNPRAPGTFAATVVIDSNEREQGRFAFTVLGTGTTPPRPPQRFFSSRGWRTIRTVRPSISGPSPQA
jgi:hypothetical protein